MKSTNKQLIADIESLKVRSDALAHTMGEIEQLDEDLRKQSNKALDELVSRATKGDRGAQKALKELEAAEVISTIDA